MSKEAMETVVRVAALDFDQDEGYFIIDQTVLALLDDPKATVKEFEEAIRARANELGKNFIFTSETSWDHRFQDLVIKIGWRPDDTETLNG